MDYAYAVSVFNEAYFEPLEMVLKTEIIPALQEKIAHAIIQFSSGILI